MKNLLFILSLFSFSALAAPFNFAADGLCFQNGDPELKRFGPMGQLGSKKGICQGMSGIVSAVREHATFQPTKSKMSANDAFWAMAELRRYHSGGCSSSKKVKITGYANLQEFCRDHKDLLMANAIDYNADIAIREIGWNIDEFLIYTDNPITSLGGRRLMHSHINTLIDYVNEGKWPLLLYYSHVVGIHSVVKTKDKVTFGIYDSNYSKSIEYSIAYSSDGLPKPGQKMVWNATPDRLTTVCW